jgi:hypothetical protein
LLLVAASLLEAVSSPPHDAATIANANKSASGVDHSRMIFRMFLLEHLCSM